MELIWTLAAFACTFGIVALLGLVVVGRPKPISTRIEELTSDGPIDIQKDATHIRRPDAVPILTRMLTGRRITERMVVELTAAGLPIRPSEFAGIILGAIIVMQLLAFAVANTAIGHILFGAIGLFGPIMVVKSMQKKRREAFDAQIVDALVTMSASCRSGFTLPRAMQMVEQEMQPPISIEFDRVVKELANGRTMEAALRAAVARVGSYDFDLVVTAILIHDQVGGQIADVMDTIADTIRERRKIQGELKALTAEGRMSGVVLVVLPIALAAVIWVTRPEYMAVMLEHPLGPTMIGVAAGMQIIGILIMRRLLALDI